MNDAESQAELTAAHAVLDEAGVPRESSSGPWPLERRIRLLLAWWQDRGDRLEQNPTARILAELTDNAEGYDHSLLLAAAHCVRQSGRPAVADRLKELDSEGREAVRALLPPGAEGERNG